jgi:Fe-S cluster assembly scaffold protein SufB
MLCLSFVSNHTSCIGSDLELSDEEAAEMKEKLIEKGGWLENDVARARLVYINGRFCPRLSLVNDSARNMNESDLDDDEIRKCLSRLTDGFTDELATPVPAGRLDELTSFSKLSGPNHNMGDPTSQFAINTQQGTACFAALNTARTGAVAFVRQPPGTDKDVDMEGSIKPVLIVNAISRSVGASSAAPGRGAACHPRTLVIAEEESRLSLVQSCVDLDEGEKRPTLYNGYTQVFVKKGANVTHSYLEETGGVVTGGTEISDDMVPEGETSPREIEAARPELMDTHLETIDAHIIGEDASYRSTLLSFGGSGRVRIALSVSLLRSGSSTTIKGFSLAGGAQRTDIKTNIHHIAQGTSSEQVQKNMIGGRATGSFRGRIRVEQSAQQTDSDQLSRTILLSDKARAWAAPTLEIIADDVKCAHGATVSDLSEEELFYLRSRGLDVATARNMLMYAFAGDISVCVDPSMRGEVDSKSGVTSRVIRRLENLVPRGERKVKGEFQSI